MVGTQFLRSHVIINGFLTMRRSDTKLLVRIVAVGGDCGTYHSAVSLPCVSYSTEFTTPNPWIIIHRL